MASPVSGGINCWQRDDIYPAASATATRKVHRPSPPARVDTFDHDQMEQSHAFLGDVRIYGTLLWFVNETIWREDSIDIDGYNGHSVNDVARKGHGGNCPHQTAVLPPKQIHLKIFLTSFATNVPRMTQMGV